MTFNHLRLHCLGSSKCGADEDFSPGVLICPDLLH